MFVTRLFDLYTSLICSSKTYRVEMLLRDELLKRFFNTEPFAIFQGDIINALLQGLNCIDIINCSSRIIQLPIHELIEHHTAD